VRQPYAELILRGVKNIEYRNSPTKLRERVYADAARRPGKAGEFEATRAQPGELPTYVLVGTQSSSNARSISSWLRVAPTEISRRRKP
jgi:ASCH domain